MGCTAPNKMNIPSADHLSVCRQLTPDDVWYHDWEIPVVMENPTRLDYFPEPIGESFPPPQVFWFKEEVPAAWHGPAPSLPQFR